MTMIASGTATAMVPWRKKNPANSEAAATAPKLGVSLTSRTATAKDTKAKKTATSRSETVDQGRVAGFKGWAPISIRGLLRWQASGCQLYS